MTSMEKNLSILLTNDDGFDSIGIKTMQQALVSSGHTVTIIAPSGQRSGSGMRISLGEFTMNRESEDIWSVDASPADTVSVGLQVIMAAANKF